MYAMYLIHDSNLIIFNLKIFQLIIQTRQRDKWQKQSQNITVILTVSPNIKNHNIVAQSLGEYTDQPKH